MSLISSNPCTPVMKVFLYHGRHAAQTAAGGSSPQGPGGEEEPKGLKEEPQDKSPAVPRGWCEQCRGSSPPVVRSGVHVDFANGGVLLVRFDSWRIAVHGAGFKIQCSGSEVENSPSRKSGQRGCFQ